MTATFTLLCCRDCGADVPEGCHVEGTDQLDAAGDLTCICRVCGIERTALAAEARRND